MAVAARPLILLYALSAKLPREAQHFVLAFAVAGSFYAASLDWAAWGKGRMALVGLAKSFAPACILVFVLAVHAAGVKVLWCAAAGNWCGFLLQAAFFLWWWKREKPQKQSSAMPTVVSESLAWRRTSVMGLAWLCYLAFNNVDMLMLGLLSTPDQVGLYGAAYRVLNQALATYYLLTQALYPQFAQHSGEERGRMLSVRVLAPLAAAGIVLAAGMILVRRTVLVIVFGHAFLAAAPLLGLLAWSLPLDFVSSYLSNAFLAWGMERKVLTATGLGAVTNIVLNWILLPHLGAWGAALNTLVSYAVLLAALLLAASSAKESARSSRGGEITADAAFDVVSCP
jgi:O-antigen/teichoic acid export membrane protein